MINLLPDDYKKDVIAARLNVTLLNYILILFGLLISVALIFGLFFVTLENNQSTALSNKDSSQKLANNYNNDQSIANEFNSNLSIARNIFADEIAYSTIITAIAEALPSGVVLDTISLQNTSINQQSTFSLHAKNYAKVSELKDSLKKSKVFSNVSLQNVQANSEYVPGGSGGGLYSDYQVSLTLSAKINKVEKT